MGFEMFQKGSAPVSRVPSVTLQKRGLVSVNRAAHALIGSPEAVQLLWDAERRIIGLKPAAEADPNAYPARPQSAKADRGPILVAGTKFTQYYDIDTSVSRRYSPYEEGGILCIDISQPGTPVTSNRASRDDVVAAST